MDLYGWSSHASCVVEKVGLGDIPELLDVEPRHRDQWQGNDFKIALDTNGILGLVCRVQSEIVGYIVFELHPVDVRIIKQVTGVAYRRCGYGLSLVDACKSWLSEQRGSVYVYVRERDLASQLFYSSSGFSWAVTVDDYHQDDRTYVMTHRI